MVGLERSTLPLIGRDSFHLASERRGAVVHRRVRRLEGADEPRRRRARARVGRRRLLIAGWAVALPVPLLIATAPSWAWIVAANVLLGINQGLAWSMTVVMKIDLVGPRRRGLALGLNEAAGYGGVALAAGLSGWLASQFAARDVLVVAGAAIAIVAFLLSVFFVRDTAAHVALEQARHHPGADGTPPRLREAFARATLPRAGASLLLAGRAGQQPQRRRSPGGSCRCTSPRTAPASRRSDSSPRSTRACGASRRSRPAHWSDTVGRKPLIVAGMLLQAVALALLALSDGDVATATGAAVLLGLGTALVYPTLIAAMSDAVSPVARAPVVGVYRFWRDLGYALGAVIAGVVADALGYGGAIAIVAALTAASGCGSSTTCQAIEAPAVRASLRLRRGKARAPSLAGRRQLAWLPQAARCVEREFAALAPLRVRRSSGSRYSVLMYAPEPVKAVYSRLSPR